MDRMQRSVGGSWGIAILAVILAFVPGAQAQWSASAVPGAATAPLGASPSDLALATHTRLIAVATEDANGVKLVDGASGAVTRTIRTDRKVAAVALDAAGTRVHVLQEGRATVTVFDAATGAQAASWNVGGDPAFIAMRPMAAELFLADRAGRRLVALDPATGAVLRQKALAIKPERLAFNAAGTRLAVTGEGKLLGVDAGSLAVVSTTAVSDDARAVGFWQSAGALVVERKADTLSLVNVDSGAVLGRVPFSTDPEAGAVDDGGAKAYVSTSDDLAVAQVDLARLRADGRFILPSRAAALAFDPAARVLYVALPKDKALLRIDPLQHPLLAEIVLARRLRDIAVSDATHEAAALDQKAEALVRLRLADRSVDMLGLPARPDRVALDPARNLAIVAMRKEVRFVNLAARPALLLPARVELAAEPHALAVDPVRGFTVALTKGADDNSSSSNMRLHLLDNVNLRLAASLPAAEKLAAVDIDTRRGIAYLLGESRGLFAFDLATRATTRLATLPFQAVAIAVDAELGVAALADEKDDKLHVVRLADGVLLRSHAVPDGPVALDLQPDTHVAVVASKAADQLSLVDLATGTLVAGYATLKSPLALAISVRFNQALAISGERDDITIVPLPNRVPQLAALSPAGVVAGSGAFTLTATGRHFVDQSKLVWGATELASEWLAPDRLQAQVPAALVAAPGTTQLSVRSPGPGGGTSSPVAFAVSSPAPEIVALEPTAGLPGSDVAIVGRGFEPSPTGNQVYFTGAAAPIVAVVVAATPTRIVVRVPDDARSGPLTVTNARGSATSDAFTVIPPPPTIAAIAPTSGAPLTVVTITGAGFLPVAGANGVSFGGAPAVVLAATPTSLLARVPTNAATGAVRVENANGMAMGPVFTVLPPAESDVQLLATPPALTVYQGAGGSLQLQMPSTGTEPFAGVAVLSVSGLPAGVTASFLPAPSIAAMQPVTLSVSASSGAATGDFTLTVRAESDAGGGLVRSASVALRVASVAGITGIKGRFVTPSREGIAGVVVRADNGATTQVQTTTDTAGNFQLVGLAPGEITLRFDATPANPLYPIWPYAVTLPANQVVVIPDWTINPPPTDDKFKPIANAAQPQVIADERFPGLEIRLPAGVEITGWDGVKKTRIAVEKVEIAKLPVQAPPAPTGAAYQLYFGTPMGGIPSQPIPVTLPNDVRAEPGESVDVWFFDGSPMGGSGEWKVAGQAIVSADGRTVRMPDGTGIPRFCGVCGLMCLGKNPPAPDKAPGDKKCAGNPVDLSNGQEMPRSAGMSCGGLTPIETGMSYNPVDAFNNVAGTATSIGFGWTLDHDIAFLPFDGPQKRLVLPGNNRVDFTDVGGGLYKVVDDPRFDGATMRAANLAANIWELKFKDGRLWRFRPYPGILSFIRGGPPTFVNEMVDARGNVLTVNRQSEGKIVSIGSNERNVSFVYGANGFASEMRDTASRVTRFAYTAGNRLSSVTDPDGRVTGYTYVDDNEFPGAPFGCGSQPSLGERLKTITYPGRPNPTVNHYGPGKRVLRQVGYDGREFRFSYRLTGACAVNQATNTVCTGLGCPDVDSWENLQGGWRIYGGQVISTTVTQPNGRTETTAFDARGAATGETNALGLGSSTKYDPAHRVVERTDALGRTTRYAYDANGNVTQTVDALGRSTQTTYHPVWNRPLTVTRLDDAGQPSTWSFEYDAAKGTMLSSTNPANEKTRFTYTPRGQLETVVNALGKATRFEYNPMGDLVRMIDPLLHEVRFGYDGAGRRTSTIDALEFTTSMAYDGINNLTRLTDARTKSTLMTFDPAGRIETVKNARGIVVESYGYDAGDRMQRRTDARQKSATYEYDASGRLARLVDRKGQASTYAYDGQDRLLTIDRPEGRTRFTYDAAGRIAEISEPGATVEFAYDAVDRIVREKLSAGGVDTVVEYGYDRLDRRVSRTVGGPSPETTTYGYDAAHRLTRITHRGSSTTFAYDLAGRLVRKTLPNGIVQGLTHDDGDRLTEIRYTNPDGSVIEAIAYTYDPNGRRLTETRAVPVSPETAFTAVYDDADRMTSITFTASGKTFNLAYDDNGNLASKSEQGTTGNVTTYVWDSRNRLVSMTAPGANATFAYDALGRRVSRTLNGVATRYVYDGEQAIGELRATGNETLLTGFALDEVIARYTTSGARTYLTDALGSVFAQAREDRTPTGLYSYSPFGETSVIGADEGNAIQYTARENDGTGLYFHRARYYDPVLKRWLSQDPLGLGAGINLYEYVFSSPTNLKDPTGEIAPFLVTGAVGAIGSALGSALSQGAACGFGNINWRSVGVAALGGFVAGVALPFVAAGGVPAAALVGGVVNTGQYYVDNAVNFNEPTGDGAAQALWTGIVGGGIGGVYGAPVFNPNVARLLQPSRTQQLLNRNAGAGNFVRSTGGGATSNAPTRGSCGCN